jgi:GTPase
MAFFDNASDKNSCSNCPPEDGSQINQLAGKLIDHDYTIALAGNPNTGKSTIFNALTGLRQHVGNWAGKTVARAEGFFDYKENTYKVIDLPGTYSLLSTSLDEEIARDYILFGKPDVTVIVADATRLERNLHLVLQVLEITDRAVVALNLIDEAKRNGIKVDEQALIKDLGVPVVPMAARRGEGVTKLMQAVESIAIQSAVTRPHRIQYLDEKLEEAIETLAAQLLSSFPNLPNARWVAMRLLEGDESIIQAVRDKKLGEISNRSEFRLPRLAEAT